MTFWGFLFMALIVFVALYAWYRFRHNDQPELFADLDREDKRAPGGRGANIIVNANQPLLTEIGRVDEDDVPIHQAPDMEAQSQNRGQKKPRDLSSQLYLSEIGSIGDATREPVALLPAPQHEHAYNAVVSESVGSNLSQAQSQGQSQAQSQTNHQDAAWLENSDLERLNNVGNVNNNRQGANFDATYGDTAASAGSYMQAQTQSYQTEVGTIGEQEDLAPFIHQAPRNTQRRGYVHKSDVAFDKQGDMEGLYNLPDQLPVLNNTNFNDPNCN